MRPASTFTRDANCRDAFDISRRHNLAKVRRASRLARNAEDRADRD